MMMMIIMLQLFTATDNADMLVIIKLKLNIQESGFFQSVRSDIIMHVHFRWIRARFWAPILQHVHGRRALLLNPARPVLGGQHTCVPAAGIVARLGVIHGAHDMCRHPGTCNRIACTLLRRSGTRCVRYCFMLLPYIICVIAARSVFYDNGILY